MLGELRVEKVVLLTNHGLGLESGRVLSGKGAFWTGQKIFDTIFDPTKTKKGIQSRCLKFPRSLLVAEK